MTYKILLTKKAQKDVEILERSQQLAVLAKITTLSSNPRPSGCEKIKTTDFWRIRYGDFRIIYQINNDVLIVLIVRVGNRKEIYKKLK